jgi:hypothetical protein
MPAAIENGESYVYKHTFPEMSATPMEQYSFFACCWRSGEQLWFHIGVNMSHAVAENDKLCIIMLFKTGEYYKLYIYIYEPTKIPLFSLVNRATKNEKTNK